MYRFFLFLLSVSLVPPLLAEEEDIFFDELPVVVSVTRLPQRVQDLPASVTVIDREMIAASGAREIPDLLRLVAGFQVGHTSIFGPRITATYHGMSDQYARRMQVLIDGRSVYMPATGGVDWYELPISMDNIERIEVTRGPNGATYGANSFLGVINIITYHPGDTQGTTVKADVGDGFYNKQLLRHAGKSGALDYMVTLEHRGDDGYEDSIVDDEFISIRDDKSIYNLNFRGDYRSSVNDYLTFQVGLNSSTLGDGEFANQVYPEHDISVTRNFEQVKWKRVLSSDQDIELNFYHIKSDNDGDYIIPKLSELFGLDPITEVPLYFGHADDDIIIGHIIESERVDLELQHRFQPNDSLQLVWGAEARYDEVTSFGFTDSHEGITNRLYRIFANGEWQANDNWIINAGAMLEKNDIVDSHLSPRISLNYKLNENNSIRAAYSRAYRTPAILEEYAYYGARFPDGEMIDLLWDSSGNLEPEEISAYELGLVGETADRKILYDIRIFREKIRNIIATPVLENANEPHNDPLKCSIYSGFCKVITYFINAGEADIDGIDLQLKLQPSSQLMVSFGFSHLDLSSELVHRIDGSSMTPTEYLPSSLLAPQNTLSLLVSYTTTSQWQTSLGFYQVGNMMFIGDNETGGYIASDLRIAKHLNLGSSKGTLAFTLQNMHGDYFDYREEIPQTRRAYLSAEFTF